MSFRVSDIHAAHEAAVEGGAEVVHGPRIEPWGTSARYQDPDGDVVELTESSD